MVNVLEVIRGRDDILGPCDSILTSPKATLAFFLAPTHPAILQGTEDCPDHEEV